MEVVLLAPPPNCDYTTHHHTLLPHHRQRPPRQAQWHPDSHAAGLPPSPDLLQWQNLHRARASPTMPPAPPMPWVRHRIRKRSIALVGSIGNPGDRALLLPPRLRPRTRLICKIDRVCWRHRTMRRRGTASTACRTRRGVGAILVWRARRSWTTANTPR